MVIHAVGCGAVGGAVGGCSAVGCGALGHHCTAHHGVVGHGAVAAGLVLLPTLLSPFFSPMAYDNNKNNSEITFGDFNTHSKQKNNNQPQEQGGATILRCHGCWGGCVVVG